MVTVPRGLPDFTNVGSVVRGEEGRMCVSVKVMPW